MIYMVVGKLYNKLASGTGVKLAVRVGNEFVTVDPSTMSHRWQLELAATLLPVLAPPSVMFRPPVTLSCPHSGGVVLLSSFCASYVSLSYPFTPFVILSHSSIRKMYKNFLTFQLS